MDYHQTLPEYGKASRDRSTCHANHQSFFCGAIGLAAARANSKALVISPKKLAGTLRGRRRRLSDHFLHLPLRRDHVDPFFAGVFVFPRSVQRFRVAGNFVSDSSWWHRCFVCKRSIDLSLFSRAEEAASVEILDNASG